MMQTKTLPGQAELSGATLIRLAHQFQPCGGCRALYHVSRMQRREDGTYLCQVCGGAQGCSCEGGHVQRE